MGETKNSSFLGFRDFRIRRFLLKQIVFIFGDTMTPKTNQENMGAFPKNLSFHKSQNVGNGNIRNVGPDLEKTGAEK